MTSTNRKPAATRVTLAQLALKPAIDQRAGSLFIITDASPAPQVVMAYHSYVAGVLTGTYIPITGGSAGGASQARYLTGGLRTQLTTGTPLIAWAGALGLNDISPGFGLKLRLYADNTGAETTTFRLRNLTTATLVAIGGVGLTTLTTAANAMTLVESVDLVTGGSPAGTPAVGFLPLVNDVYQLEMFTSTGATFAELGSFALVSNRIP